MSGGDEIGVSGVNTYQVIDERNWERAMHCMVFRGSVEPAFCVTFEADITNFRRKVKAQNLSFTLSRHISLGKDSRFFNERNGSFDFSKAAV